MWRKNCYTTVPPKWNPNETCVPIKLQRGRRETPEQELAFCTLLQPAIARAGWKWRPPLCRRRISRFLVGRISFFRSMAGIRFVTEDVQDARLPSTCGDEICDRALWASNGGENTRRFRFTARARVKFAGP